MNRIVWLACQCMVWPIVLGHRAGVCKRCGYPPDTPVDEPPDGKAIERTTA